MRLPTLASFMLLAVRVASGQTATVTVAHNDSDGLVEPGQVVTITATISWTGALALWEVKGGIRATPDWGTASNARLRQFFPPLPASVLEPGTPIAGSLSGTHLLYGTLGWFGFQSPDPPWGQGSGLELVAFDWTAPTESGQVRFDWLASTSVPQPLMVFFQAAPIQPISTTYVGTSLVVVPAPSGLTGLLSWWAASRRRRRA